MDTKIINRQELAWELSPSKESGRKIAGKNEGFHLPNSVTEDVGGFSLMPHYFVNVDFDQLRRMARKRGHGKDRGISGTTKNQWRMVPKW